VVAAVDYLKARPEVDAGHVGLMGTSQAGWVAPMAAVRSADVRFVILKLAAGVTPEEQELARGEMGMRANGEAPAEIAQAQAIYRQVIAYARAGKDWEALSTALAAARGKKWNLFGEVTRDWWFLDSIRLCYAHDPLPPLRELTAPSRGTSPGSPPATWTCSLRGSSCKYADPGMTSPSQRSWAAWSPVGRGNVAS
jgi:hypothetical protein